MKTFYNGFNLMSTLIIGLVVGLFFQKCSQLYEKVDSQLVYYQFGYTSDKLNDYGRALLIVIFLMVASALMAGCTTIHYKDGTAEFTRTSFGTQLQVSELKASTDEKGNRSIMLQGYMSDQVQALEKVAEGVAKGLVAGAKP